MRYTRYRVTELVLMTTIQIDSVYSVLPGPAVVIMPNSVCIQATDYTVLPC